MNAYLRIRSLCGSFARAAAGSTTNQCFRCFGQARDPSIYRQVVPTKGVPVIVLGIILLIIGLLAKIAVLWTIGIIVLVVGAILALLGTTGRAVGGRRHWY